MYNTHIIIYNNNIVFGVYYGVCVCMNDINFNKNSLNISEFT